MNAKFNRRPMQGEKKKKKIDVTLEANSYGFKVKAGQLRFGPTGEWFDFNAIRGRALIRRLIRSSGDGDCSKTITKIANSMNPILSINT